MRPTPSPLSTRIPPVDRPPADRRPGDEKSQTEPKPRPKRCLNEAAHKLGNRD
jgi:hypothetical protein